MTGGTTYDEAAVVVQARRGDRAAFGELVTQYQRRAYAIAYGFVGNREDALELAQEAFARAYKAMERFDTRMPFYPWFYRIVKNICLNHLKKRRRRGETSLDGLMESGFGLAAKGPGPPRNAALADLRKGILEAKARGSKRIWGNAPPARRNSGNSANSSRRPRASALQNPPRKCGRPSSITSIIASNAEPDG